MQITRINERVGGDLCDVHARLDRRVGRDQTARYREHVAWCGVYVRPVGPVPGYWYFPACDDTVTSSPTAATILRSLGVLS